MFYVLSIAPCLRHIVRDTEQIHLHHKDENPQPSTSLPITIQTLHCIKHNRLMNLAWPESYMQSLVSNYGHRIGNSAYAPFILSRNFACQLCYACGCNNFVIGCVCKLPVGHMTNSKREVCLIALSNVGSRTASTSFVKILTHEGIWQPKSKKCCYGPSHGYLEEIRCVSVFQSRTCRFNIYLCKTLL